MKKIHAILLDGETPLTDTSLLVQARYSANIGKDGGEVNGKVGKLNVKIKFPKDALAEDAEISMQVPEQLPASLPYKGGHPMELIAIGKSNNNRIHQFNNSIEVQISYDPSEIGIHPSTLALYWFDEATGTWRVVPSYTDEEKNILYGLTDHFSLFSTGQNSWESMKIPPIDGELVSTFVGSASYSIPIEVPAGPGGIAPSISLNYDSMSVEGITNQKSTSGGTSGTSDGTQTSWVGAGWSLASGGYIMRNMGENVDWSGDDTFSLVVGGNSFRLVPVSHTADYSYIDYKPTDENFWLIRRYKSQGTQSYQKITTDAYGNKVVTSASASSEDDQWVAWDKAGVRYKFGYRQDRQTRAYYVETYRDNAAPPAQLCILATNRVCIFRPWGWFLEEIKYPSGQTLTFTYTKDQDNKCYGDWVKVGSVDTCSFYAYADQATYPAEIQYPDQKTKIIFNPDANNREDYLWHYGDFGTKIRYEKKRLQSIQVKVDGITIREYKLDYYLTGEVPIFPESKWTPKDPLTNNNIKDDKRMSVLKTVTQYGLGGITGGGPTLQPITFKYGQFNLNNVNYNVGDQMHLSQVSNGQGGTVYFVYEDNDGNDNKPWAATDGGTTQRITKSSQFVLHSGEEQIINQFDADNNEKFLPVMPGIRYRFGCTVVGQHAAGTTVEFKLLSRANDEGTYSGTSVDASNSSTNDKAISGYVDLPMNANRATPKVQLDAGSIATLKGCNVVPLTTHYRVQKRIVTDSASKPGQIISYPFTYEYTGAAVNDTVHSTYAGLDVTVRSGGSEPNTEFRGHSKVTMTDPYNLKTETYFYQDDVRKGKVSDVKKYDISQGNLLLSWSKTNWPTPGVDQTVPVDTDTKVCARRDVYASCFQDQKVIWETSDWEEYRDYGAGATSEASTNFVGTRTEYYYAPKEAGGWGNLVGILERSWNGTQWIAYRLTRTSYLSQSQGSYNDGGANIDTTKNWTGLPASTNVYLCPAGSADCSFTKQGSVWTYPPIENLVNSSCNLYETPTDQGSGTATCSILKSGSATVENLDTLNSATLTGKRTLLHFGDGATANYSDPHYSDELYVFDSWGNRTKRITNPKEGTASGRADKVYSSDNQVTTWDYDNSAFAARVTKETNPLSQITQYSYDDIIPTGGTVPVPMGGYYLGLPTMETDANSASAYAQYDAFGRMTALILPGDTSASPTIKAAYHEFDPNTNTPAWIEVSQKDRFGQYTSNIRKIFNGLARLIQTQTGGATVQGSPRDIITQTEYDAYGRTTKQSTPIDLAVWDGSGNPYREQAFAADHSNFTETAYDAAGRVKTATASDLTTTSSAYSIGTLPTQGNLLLTTVTDARNNATMNYKDAFGHLMYVDASTGPDVSYTYTVTDLLTAATYGVATTNLTYDLAGRKTSLTDPDMGSWTYQYDALGNLKTQADTRGCSTALTYDRLNRLTGKAFANCSGTNPAISFTYDASSATNSGKSRRTGMTDASGTTTWEYDMRGRVTHESRHILDQLDGNRDLGTYHTYWSYNTDNSVRQMIYPNGETVDFAYHPQGAINQVSSIQDASDITQSYVTATSYDAAGRVTNRSLGNGINQTYTYYPWNQQGGRLNVILAQKSGLPDYQNTTLTYDPVGNIHTLLDSAANEPLTTFTYDSLNRLDLVTGAYSEDPVYDPSTGNISSRNNITYTYGDTAHKHAVTTTSDGRAFGYDANGNMTTRNIPGGSYNLGYDAENRLTTINGGPTNARYAYDGDGKRVIALVNGVRTVYIGDYFEAELGSATTFPVVVDPIISNIPYKVFLPIVCQEDTTVSVVGMTNGNFGMTLYYTHPNKTEQNSITWRTYYSAAGARIAMRSQGNSSSYDLYYFMTDHLNSTAKTIKQDGTVSEIRYAAWGETRYTSGTTPTKRQYTGQYMAEAGLYFYGARWYDNSLGRFAQPDTIIPQPGNPMAWDRYSYGFENPIRYNDPSGHCPMCIGAIGGAIGGAIYGYGSQVVNNLNQGMGLGQALTTNISGTTVLLYTGAGAVIGAGVAPLVAPAAAWIAGAIATGGTAATAAEVGTAATTAACADGDCTNEAQLASQAAQKGLEAIQNNSGTGYKTFEAFKNAQGGAGNGWAWHHIVSKLPENITQFGEQMIHNTNNLIRLPDQAGQLHRQITGIYNSINPLITGSNTMRVRDWLTTLSFEEQWMFGMNLIQKLGGGQYIIDKFK